MSDCESERQQIERELARELTLTEAQLGCIRFDPIERDLWNALIEREAALRAANLRIGHKVRVKLGRSHVRGRRGTARIEQLLSDIDGGVRLDRMLAGFHYWNVEDLERAH